MRSALVILAVAVAAMSAGAPAQEQTLQLPLRITAWAVNMSNIATGANSTVQITIDRWSTDVERDTLARTFLEKGADKLIDVLQGTRRVGFMRLPNSLGYDLHFARLHPEPDGGSRIVLMTDRYIGTWEARNQPRVMDYPFTLIELRLKPDGTGEGKASIATKITYNKEKQAVELENYATEPVRLQQVRVQSGRS